jgi:hypothetical protein
MNQEIGDKQVFVKCFLECCPKHRSFGRTCFSILPSKIFIWQAGILPVTPELGKGCVRGKLAKEHWHFIGGKPKLARCPFTVFCPVVSSCV